MNTWQDWLEHPIVQTAQEALPPDASALDLLTETLRLLNELDERFPGLSMDEILRARNSKPATRRQVRAKLLRAGADPADVAIVAPSVIDLAASEAPWTDLNDEFGLSAANRVLSARTPPSERDRELVALVDEGLSQHEAARVAGCAYSVVNRAVERSQYERRETA